MAKKRYVARKAIALIREEKGKYQAHYEPLLRGSNRLNYFVESVREKAKERLRMGWWIDVIDTREKRIVVRFWNRRGKIIEDFEAKL